jgi:hypothetical protein
MPCNSVSLLESSVVHIHIEMNRMSVSCGLIAELVLLSKYV